MENVGGRTMSSSGNLLAEMMTMVTLLRAAFLMR